MLENYNGKYVKALISSGSGASIGNVAGLYNSVITLFGTIKKSDEKFVEFENTTMLYYPGVNYALDHFGTMSPENTKQPLAFENATTLVNVNNIITLSIIK